MKFNFIKKQIVSVLQINDKEQLSISKATHNISCHEDIVDLTLIDKNKKINEIDINEDEVFLDGVLFTPSSAFELVEALSPYFAN